MSDLHDRRTFLTTLGGAALALASSRRLAALSGETRKLKRVGLQLYTVRDAMQKDVPGTLAKVAQIGYKEVEFAGYFGHSPNEIRELLKKNGLTSPSSHVAYPESMEAWKKTVDEAKTAGHQYVTVAWTPEDKRTGPDAWKRIADTYNQAGRVAKDAGLRFAYHNHDYELAKSGDVVPLDALFQDTDPALVTFEMDLYWMVHGGADPLAYMKKYPGRVGMVHVKDAKGDAEKTMTAVGQGTIDFKKIFEWDEDHGAHIKHYFVEHDQPADPFASITTSYNYLANLSF
jgi:sugar phosphate isomerase/epimerase